jgi:hypothetical protein
MLTIWGQSHGRFCDGLARREFIKIGALGGALSLADVFRAQAQAATTPGTASPLAKKSVIMVYLLGGPSQIDTWDMKPEAPLEYRGEYQPIKTNVEGIEICELFPQLATRMDKLSIIRSLSATSPNNHSDAEAMTGRNEIDGLRGQHPCIGSVVSKLRGEFHRDVPQYVALRKMTFPTPTPLPQSLFYLQSGQFGPAHAPFLPTGPGLADLQLAEGLDLGRVRTRQSLLDDFDRMRRELDHSGKMAALDSFQEQAYSILTANRLRSALDLEQEDPRVVERYSFNNGQKNSLFAKGYAIGTQMLLARRLVEAGVGFVEVALGYWDTHGPSNVLGFPAMREKLCPTLDQSLSALLDDLHARGMEKDVVVLIWGEFGRSPRINKDAGRDHWLPAMSALITGGGLKTGQVIGATDAKAEFVKDRPYSFSNVLSTVYRTIGIDPATSFINSAGRPVHLLDDREPVRELI